MLDFLKLKSSSNGSLGDFKDPFTKDSVKSIWFWIRKNWKGVVEYSAEIEFKNNNTQGKQEFKTEDFPSLVKKVEDFIKAL